MNFDVAFLVVTDARDKQQIPVRNGAAKQRCRIGLLDVAIDDALGGIRLGLRRLSDRRGRGACGDTARQELPSIRWLIDVSFRCYPRPNTCRLAVQRALRYSPRSRSPDMLSPSNLPLKW